MLGILKKLAKYAMLPMIFCVYGSSAADSVQATANKLRPVYGRDPSSTQFSADRASLHAVALSGDLPTFKKAAEAVEIKWQTIDANAYLCLLSEECDDLTSYQFHGIGIDAITALRDAVCDKALVSSSQMPLAMQAYFVEHLDYVPGHASSTDASGAPWSSLRVQRTILWLSTLQQISTRIQPIPARLPSKPSLPGRKYITARVIVNGFVDPSEINDPLIRREYAAAWSAYDAAMDEIDYQKELAKLATDYTPSVGRFLIDAYSSAPVDTNSLVKYMKQYGVGSDEQSYILQAVSANLDANKSGRGNPAGAGVLEPAVSK
jgi:hypothetical protein